MDFHRGEVSVPVGTGSQWPSRCISIGRACCWARRKPSSCGWSRKVVTFPFGSAGGGSSCRGPLELTVAAIGVIVLFLVHEDGAGMGRLPPRAFPTPGSVEGFLLHLHAGKPAAGRAVSARRLVRPAASPAEGSAGSSPLTPARLARFRVSGV